MQLSQTPQVTILNYEDYNSLKKQNKKTGQTKQKILKTRKKRTYKRNSEINDTEFPQRGCILWGLSLNEEFQISSTPNISLG